MKIYRYRKHPYCKCPVCGIINPYQKCYPNEGCKHLFEARDRYKFDHIDFNGYDNEFLFIFEKNNDNVN